MIIDELGIYNFGQYRDEQRLYLTPDPVLGKTITLIGGMNGGGKTTILDAVLLTLYGQRYTSFKESGLSYSNFLESSMHRSDKLTTNQSWVELIITTHLNEKECKLKIRRTWEKGNTRIKESLLVWKDNVVDNYLALNWDSYIEELLPYGIANLFFFDGEKISKLANDNDGNEIMKKSIQSLLGIDVVERLITDMKRIIIKQEKQIPNVEADVDFNNLKKVIQIKQLELQAVNQEMSSVKTNITKLNNKLEQGEEEFLKSGGELALSRANLLSQKEKLDFSLAQGKEKMVSLASSALPLSIITSLMTNIFENMNDEKTKKETQSILPILQNRDDLIMSALKIYDAPIDVQEKLSIYLHDLRKNYEESAATEFYFPTSNKNIDLIQRFLTRESQELRFSAENIINENKTLEVQHNQVERYLMFEVDESKTNIILNEIKTVSQKIGKLEGTLSGLEKIYQQKGLEIEKLTTEYRKKLESLLGINNTKNESGRIIEYALRTQKKMEHFIQVLKLNKVEELSNKITEAFLFLVHKISLVSKIIVETETLDIKLLDTVGRELPKSRLSAGEKQMLAISILWGLAKASGRKLPIIIDTPMGRLDSSHRLNFVEKYLPNASHQVIILSTDTEIQGQYLSPIINDINMSYMLNYDPVEQNTRITEGYFVGEAI